MMVWLQSRLLWGIAALGLLVMVGGFGYAKGHAAGAAAGAVKVATLTAQYQAASAKAASDALAKQTALQVQYAAIDAQRTQEFKNAQAKSDAVVADLRAGTLRLRREWAGCQATASVPGSAAGTSQPDAAAEQRSQGAGDLVRIGADADAQIRALQAVVKADRQ